MLLLARVRPLPARQLTRPPRPAPLALQAAFSCRMVVLQLRSAGVVEAVRLEACNITCGTPFCQGLALSQAAVLADRHSGVEVGECTLYPRWIFMMIVCKAVLISVLY